MMSGIKWILSLVPVPKMVTISTLPVTYVQHHGFIIIIIELIVDSMNVCKLYIWLKCREDCV